MAVDLSSFNASQREAICHVNGPALVLAGPGSGKTTVLTRRLQYLIETVSIPPEKILVVTFTKAAAVEMQQRFEHLAGAKLPVHFGTFHSIFYRILQEHSKDNSLTLLNETEKQAYMKSILRHEQIDGAFAPAVLKEISVLKGGAISDASKEKSIRIPKSIGSGIGSMGKQEITQEQLERIFEAYRQKCRKAHKLDFDDMAYECLRLFTEEPDVLKLWQMRFPYIMVDEYQDIAPIQEKLLFLLALPENNLFLVGDDDQCIYGFRGAAAESMLSFPYKYPQSKRICLSVNYRSRTGIVEAACKVIAENKKRFAKEQHSARGEKIQESSKLLTEQAVICRGFSDRKTEHRQILSHLNEWKRQGRLSRTAILYRRHADAGMLMMELAAQRIPFVRLGKEQNLYGHFVMEDITAYLRLIYGGCFRSDFYKIMNRPERGIERESCRTEKIDFSEMITYHKYDTDIVQHIRKLEADLRRASGLSLYAAIVYIRRGMGYEEYLKSHDTDGAALQILQQIQELARGITDLAAWERMLCQEREKREKGQGEVSHGNMDGVRIMTYHAAKGLEFDQVIMPDLNEGTVPYKKAVLEKEIEEERRMFYVGMTRARDQLYLYYRSGTKEEPETMSRFLKPLMPM